jgi:hypothetical protein
MTDLCQAPDLKPRKPRVSVPAGATDSHFHLFGPQSRYPLVAARDYSCTSRAPGRYASSSRIPAACR